MKKLLLSSFAAFSIAAAATAGVQADTNTAQAAEQTSTQSVHDRFIAAGGTEAMWEYIVMPESSGNQDAVNELGYRGLGQTKEYWGTGTVEEQTKGMIQYAEDRYGSIDNAIQFRMANNWW